MTADDRFSEALADHEAGRYGCCEDKLRTILAQDPKHAMSLSLLGSVRWRVAGPTPEAIGFMRQAVACVPDNPDLVNNLGAILWAAGQLKDAREHFERVVGIAPEHVDAWHNLGKVALGMGAAGDAESAYRKALGIDPGRHYVAISLASLLARLGRFQEAVAVLREAIDRNPGAAECHATLGRIQSLAGHVDESVESYRRAITLRPDRVDYHVNLGQLYIDQGELVAAREECRRAIVLDDASFAAYNNLGVVLRDLGDPEAAVAAFKVARRLGSDAPGIAVNLGIALHDSGRYQEACREFESALATDPNWSLARINLANSYLKAKRFAEAEAAYTQSMNDADPRNLVGLHAGRGYARMDLEKPELALEDFDIVIRERPDHAQVRFARAVANLRLGRFDEGWSEYEWRFAAAGATGVTKIDWDQAEWDGSPFPGKTLMVHHEQGLGDAIHFVRYLAMVKQLGGEVLLRCGPPLFRLFETVEGVDRMTSRRSQESTRMAEYDLQVPLVTLPHLFATGLESIPADVPYLYADPALVAKWSASVHPETFSVGLVWEGNPDQGDNGMRSCKLSDFAPLSAVPGVRFYSLQVGAASEQAKNPPKGMTLIDETAGFHDMAETAAFISNLDLVITVDTSVAHLAGALGHPVWTVLWSNCCWRYLRDREDSPWYPSMRLFRQAERGNWADVMHRVSDALARHVAQHVRRATQSRETPAELLR